MRSQLRSLDLRLKWRPTATLSLIAFALAAAALGESSPWTSLGPFGLNSSVQSLAVDPSHPSTLYAGIGTLETDRGGLFKSTDGGLTWNRTGAPLTYPLTIVIDPAHPSTVYAGGLPSLFKSDDAGASWRSIGAGLPGDVFALLLDPESTSTAYAVGGGVFKTTDGGETWADVSHGLQPATGDIAIDPTTPSTLYLASDASAGGVYKSTDGGGSWTSVLGVSAQKVFVMNATPQIVFASTSSGVLRSVDRGATWASAATGLTGSIALAFASDAHDVYASNGSGVFRAAGGGVEWTPLGNAGPVLSLALDPSSASTIFAGAFQTGFLRSLDGGTSWTSSNVGLTNVFVTALGVAPTEPSALYAGLRPGDVFKSTDRGATWTEVSPIVTQEPVTAFAFDPSAPGVVYVALSRDGLFRTADGGATWSPADTGLSVPPFYGSQMITALAVDPVHPSTLYAGLSTYAFGGFANGYVFKSTDQGATWTQLSLLLEGWVLGLAVDPRSPSSVYVNGARSMDAGATWQLLDGPCSGAFAGALAVASDSSLYTACGSAYRSTDHAQSWVALGSDGTSLAVDPTDPLAVYLGGPTGVTRTLDGGATWSAVNDGLTDPAVMALAVDPAHPSNVYAGTNSTGVFSKDFSGRAEPLCTPSATTLCLVGNRFKAEVAWSVPSDGRSGRGMVRPLTTDTGSFWFFSPDNIELVLKVLDGRTLNGAFWVFYGALSDVQYTVTVTDTQTGAIQTYDNPAGALSSRADTSAFPQVAGLSTRSAAATRSSSVVEDRSAAELYGLYAGLKGARDRREPVVAACVPGGAVLCLDEARFQVTVSWEVPGQGTSGDGVAVPLTGNTGYFWFFDDSNVELMVKVLDGDAINGHHWVFYGALSNVKYTITVTDTQTGAIRTYDNASGELASVADTTAF